MIRCLILYAMPYSISDEKTGEVNEGISTTYLPSVDLTPFVDDNGSMGIMTCKQSFSTSFFDKFVKVPGIYDIDFMMKSVKGKPVMTPSNITFISEAVISEVKKG